MTFAEGYLKWLEEKCSCGHIQQVHNSICLPNNRPNLYNEECFCVKFEKYSNLRYLERLYEKIGK